MYCRNCGKEILNNAFVCVNCGVIAQDGGRYCQVCGAESNPNAVFCVKCGNSLGRRGVRSKIIAGIFGILLGGFGIHGVYRNRNNSDNSNYNNMWDWSNLGSHRRYIDTL